MANQNTKNIVLPKSAIKQGQGIVVLPLEKWREIEQTLEDFEMYSSKGLAKEIDKRRKEKEVVSLEKILKKYHI